MPARTGRGEYGWLAPLFVELAALPLTTRARSVLRDRLVREHLPVARNIARRFRGRGEPLPDLEQVATLGLIKAVDRYDPDRGSDFLAFAVPTITGEVRRHFRDHGWATRVPRRLKEMHSSLALATGRLSQELGRAPRPRELAAHLDVPLEEVIEGLGAARAYHSRSLDQMTDNEDSGAPPVEMGEYDKEMDMVENREALAPLLADLPARERTIIMLRFFGNQTQTQIADHFGMSQMHVSRLLSRTLRVLRMKLEVDLPVDAPQPDVTAYLLGSERGRATNCG